MATTCPTTEAALQAGLLPAQERREGHFAKVSGRLKNFFQTALCLCGTHREFISKNPAARTR